MSVNLLNQTTVQLTQINCGKCGGTYALNERYRADRQKEGNGWHCPYCQTSWGYFGNGDIDDLKKKVANAEYREKLERERKERALSEANQLRFSLRSQKGAMSRIKNRVKHGVCPCCTRSFTNLREHMKTQHPDYSAEKTA
jgi:hypothetical protein